MRSVTTGADVEITANVLGSRCQAKAAPLSGVVEFGLGPDASLLVKYEGGGSME